MRTYTLHAPKNPITRDKDTAQLSNFLLSLQGEINHIFLAPVLFQCDLNMLPNYISSLVSNRLDISLGFTKRNFSLE